MDEHQLLGKDSKATHEILEKIKKTVNKYKNKQDIKIQNRNQVSRTTTKTFTNKPMGQIERPIYAQDYEEILRGKINNENIKKEAINFAELIIQPTCYCELKLGMDKGQSVQLKIICTLPDHEQHFRNFWIGKTLDSPGTNLNELVSRFRTEMRNYNIAEVIIEERPQTGGTIINTTTSFQFV